MKRVRKKVVGKPMDFYVDPKRGKDSNDGLTKKTAVKTLKGLQHAVEREHASKTTVTVDLSNPDDRRIGPDDRRAREPVNYRYDALNPEFEKMLAMIASYADEKYTDCHLYAKLPDRLRGEKSPINHMREHLRQYIVQKPYDKFDGDIGWHLAAIAYNAMMELFYLRKFGPVQHALVLEHRAPIKPFNVSDEMQRLMFNASTMAMANLMTRSLWRRRRRKRKKR
jgi:hypothetical protein